MANLYLENQVLRTQLLAKHGFDDESVDCAINMLGRVIKGEFPITSLSEEDLELIYIATNY
jgi:hypothetical protein